MRKNMTGAVSLLTAFVRPSSKWPRQIQNGWPDVVASGQPRFARRYCFWIGGPEYRLASLHLSRIADVQPKRLGNAGPVGWISLQAIRDVATLNVFPAPPRARAVFSNSTCCWSGDISRNNAPGCEK